MTKPYAEGKTWSFRMRRKGHQVYKSGFKTEAAAKKAIAELIAELNAIGAPVGQGSQRTSMGVALADYAREVLPYLKGAYQEANRINRYLRPLGLPVIKVSKFEAPVQDIKAKMRNDQGNRLIHHRVELVQEPRNGDQAQRRIPNSLKLHRKQLAEEGKTSDLIRKRIASSSVSELRKFDLQELMDAMKQDGYGAATVALERALLRSFFNYVRNVWNWPEPVKNPAIDLRLDKVENERDRVMNCEEWCSIGEYLFNYQNPEVFPLTCLLLETSMRTSEPILYAHWEDIDWEKCTLRLTDSKVGARTMPLSIGAIEVLQWVRDHFQPLQLEGRIFKSSYEALKKAWNLACKHCGVDNLRLYDSRHTAATRFAIELKGDLSAVKCITGHKNFDMLNRYINRKPDEVASQLHGRELTSKQAPAGLGSTAMRQVLDAIRVKAMNSGVSQTSLETTGVCEDAPKPYVSNVVQVQFRRAA